MCRERVCGKGWRKGAQRNYVQGSLLKIRDSIESSFLPPHKANLICRVEARKKMPNFVSGHFVAKVSNTIMPNTATTFPNASRTNGVLGPLRKQEGLQGLKKYVEEAFIY